MITKRDFILRGSCFCEKCNDIRSIVPLKKKTHLTARRTSALKRKLARIPLKWIKNSGFKNQLKNIFCVPFTRLGIASFQPVCIASKFTDLVLHKILNFMGFSSTSTSRIKGYAVF